MSDTISVIIDEPDEITINPILISNADCGQQNGMLRVTGQGGAGVLQFIWQNTLGVEVNPYSLFAGTYFLFVEDSLGCRKSFGPSVVEDNPGVAAIYSLAKEADCTNANGAIDLSITNGQAPFSINGVLY
ncbi:MAG: hypothetical protein WBA74_19540, partial [Cyclobacteriaceae bacterium]